MKQLFNIFLIPFMIFILLGCSTIEILLDDGTVENQEHQQKSIQVELDKDGSYTSRDEVALFIHVYSKLPDNFITKAEARKLGWEASEGNLWEVTDQKSIGGDRFGNREGLLPARDGRQYYEADINYHGGFRNAERIVYSNDGLIYFTEDHYDTFILLYGDE